MVSILKFVICTAVILISGKRVAKYGDIIAEKTGLGGLWIGLVLVSIATSLPEIFTGVGSTIFVDAPDLTVGNLFGANTYNLANIAVLDFFHKGGPLLSSLSLGQLLTAGLSALPVLVALFGIFLSVRGFSFGILNISIYSFLILAVYIISTRIIYKFEMNKQKFKPKEKETLLKYNHISLKQAWIFYGISASVIVAAGIWLAYIGDELAQSFGLGRNFIGNLFLGFATTLPEIIVSISAFRLGAKELAIANMFGSNLFNITVIFVNDVFYSKAQIFDVISQNHIFMGLSVVLMTLIVVIGFVLKPKRKTRFKLSNYTFLLIGVFIVSMYLNFVLCVK